jgi:site-specific DNA-methyltransferase (adenine-specific)
MGKAWDRTGVAFRPDTWRAVLDVMKPGAHLVAFGGSRTYHRMACAR